MDKIHLFAANEPYDFLLGARVKKVPSVFDVHGHRFPSLGLEVLRQDPSPGIQFQKLFGPLPFFPRDFDFGARPCAPPLGGWVVDMPGVETSSFKPLHVPIMCSRCACIGLYVSARHQ